MMQKIDILYEDAQILVIVKPAGIASQSDRGSAPDVVNALKNQLFLRDKKVPEIFCVHRLDKPVAGLMVYAKSKQAAAFLGKQVQEGETFTKRYYALAEGEFPETIGVRTKAVDWLLQDKRENASKVVSEGTPGAKRAELFYTGLRIFEGKTLFDVELITGRHHQIRVQMAARSMGLFGDRKYNQKTTETRLGLCCHHLAFVHPKSREAMTFEETWERLTQN
ncbi:MAG: RluA family pseudouridine synthase [Lachnospiraceae bacterium]|nr:RluA family pseudouridine synthase [Lachnospiraceae bacterium]